MVSLDACAMLGGRVETSLLTASHPRSHLHCCFVAFGAVICGPCSGVGQRNHESCTGHAT